MEIVTQLTALNVKYPGITMALGTFDGIHLGHQQIISQAVDLARQINGTSVVFTFSNHPLSIVAPERQPLQLVTQEDKAELIAELGVDILLTIPFTPEFLQLSATDFIRLLLENLSPKHIVVGPNYYFGYNRSGTPEMLQQAGKKNGFDVNIHPIVYLKNTIVSSTLIRKMISAGKVEQASFLLGRQFKIKGLVIHGEKRGRTLGYPTINLEISNELVLPANGVYAVTIDIGRIQYNGIANIGTNPTFNGIQRHLEAHILDFAGDLYGTTVTVTFLQHIREQQKFSSADELKMQNGQDIKGAKHYYTK